MTTRMSMGKKTKAVIRVGDGRGFIVEAQQRRGRLVIPRRFVITAAHCLPHLPPCHAAAHWYEKTYKLLGRLDQAPTVYAECLFADPIADIAVLCTPENQEMASEADAYEELTNGATYRVGNPPRSKGGGWLLTLDARWARCVVKCSGDGLWIHDFAGGTQGGMSGSPILTHDRAAIGVVSVGSNARDYGEGHNPSLAHHLPGWLLRDLGLNP